jgi:signal transduction histidine kinase
VVVTKSNFVIALAPYFFPLYAVLVVLAFLAGQRIWDWRVYLVWFHLLLGAAYAFHVTLTWHILKHDQSDISGQGYLFSAVVIFLGNIAVLLVGIPLLVQKVDVLTALSWWVGCTIEGLQRLARVL